MTLAGDFYPWPGLARSFSPNHRFFVTIRAPKDIPGMFDVRSSKSRLLVFIWRKVLFGGKRSFVSLFRVTVNRPNSRPFLPGFT